MEKRIKFIHGLTICVIVAYCIAQGYWLYRRYQLSLEEYKTELYDTIVACAEEEMAVRRDLPHPPRIYGNQSKMTYDQKANNAVETWTYEIFVIDTLNHSFSIPKGVDASTYLLDYITNIRNKHPSEVPDGMELFKFTCDNKDVNGTNQVLEALNRFIVDHQHPFQVARLDSILRSRGITAQSIATVKADTMVWQSSMQLDASIWHPLMTVSFPYDIFEGQQVVVETAISMSPVIKRMGYTLLMTIMLSFFLIFCLVYQILTIRKQRHIEAVRQEFMHTMIHELKRPISTLKMCMSFMGNEKMMQDEESKASSKREPSSLLEMAEREKARKEFKQRILASSCNELDNLTSYFSKLRDITFSDAAEIPLVKTEFHLRELMEECIGKQNIPNGKEVRMEIVAQDDLEIRADRMHLANIVCNLLENAIKYSKEAVAIQIDYMMRADGQLQITVEDNGIGIAKTDQKYVFDKFYRSETAKDKAIPGIGIGLSYVKLLVEAHGGTVSFESIEGKGCTFTILLPQTDGKD